jgi:hypothetical protein
VHDILVGTIIGFSFLIHLRGWVDRVLGPIGPKSNSRDQGALEVVASIDACFLQNLIHPILVRENAMVLEDFVNRRLPLTRVESISSRCCT